MPQTITTYGNNSWPVTTTIWPQPGGGYNYTRIGNGGPAWGGVTAAPGTTVSAAVGSHGQIVPIVTPNAPQPDPDYSMRAQPIQIPTDEPDYYPVRHAAPRPMPTPEMWVDLYTGKSVPAPKGLKHTAEGEALINPYTHGATPTDHPPSNPKPWQQYLIDCKVPSTRLMRERTLLAYMDGFGVIERYKIQIGYDLDSENKNEQEFNKLLSSLTPNQRLELKNTIYKDFGMAKPTFIPRKELIPYLRLWIRSNNGMLGVKVIGSTTK